MLHPRKSGIPEASKKQKHFVNKTPLLVCRDLPTLDTLLAPSLGMSLAHIPQRSIIVCSLTLECG